MPEHSEAYTLAGHIHDSFYGFNGVLTAEEIIQSGVIRAMYPARPAGRGRLEAWAEVNGHHIRQALTRTITGLYYFSTIDTEPGGSYGRVHIGPYASFDAVDLLANSIFMHRLVAVGHARHE